MILKYTVINDKYKTLRQVLKNEWNISSRLIIKLKKNKAIFVNNTNVYVDYPLHLGDEIYINIDFQECSENIVPIDVKLDIIYEDEYYIIINKPANMPVHPAGTHYTDSLSNALQHYFYTKNIQTKIRPVNRLDKDTSGIVVFAKNEYIQEALIKQMQTKEFVKEYIAILEGNLSATKGTINAPIGRKENSIIERCISTDGANAITHYELIKNCNNYCVVKFILETGRTHQIRLHCKYIGHPIIGDSLYGNSSKSINRQALHAYKVSFIHPILGTRVVYESEIADDMKFLLES